MTLDEMKDKIKAANKVMVLSGAGLSAPSGISTFRDTNGLWNNHRISDVAVISAFKKKPELAWSFYDQRREQLHEVFPNAAHYAIAKLQKSRDNVKLVTQNVDNLLERAGCKDVRHAHGKLTDTRCMDCGYGLNNDFNPRTNDHTCFLCGGILRPGVVLFGEQMPPDEEKVEQYVRGMDKDDVMILVGAGLEVFPVAEYPSIALNNGVMVIEVNVKPVLTRWGAIPVPFSCDEALPLLI